MALGNWLLALPTVFFTVPAVPATSDVIINWAEFQDPSERAFTLDVPQGWTVKGGLFRMGYSDARCMVDLKSPDGRLNIRIREVSIPTYFVPNQHHPQEGATLDLGAQAQLTVARYRSGQAYAEAYAQVRFRSVCRNLSRREPDSSAPVQDFLPEEVRPVQSSAGQVAYACESELGPRIAYAYARTSLHAGFWQVPSLASFSAPPEQVALARSVLLRATQSFRLSNRWMEYQKRMEQEADAYQRARQADRRRELSRQVAEFEVRMQSMRNQVGAFEHQQARQADQVQSFGNILTGLTPTTDPYGNHRDVWTGPKNAYWIDGQGRTVNSDTAPGPGWQALTPR